MTVLFLYAYCMSHGTAGGAVPWPSSGVKFGLACRRNQQQSQLAPSQQFCCLKVLAEKTVYSGAQIYRREQLSCRLEDLFLFIF